MSRCRPPFSSDGGPRARLEKEDPSYQLVHLVKVSRSGQIGIPKEVRAKHGLGRGTDLVLLESGDALVLRKRADVERILNNEFAPLVRATEDALRDLWENSEDDVWDGV